MPRKSSLHEFNNDKKKSAWGDWDIYKSPLSQQTLILVNPFHGFELSLRKQHSLVSPAVLPHEGDILHAPAKYSGCKM